MKKALSILILACLIVPVFATAITPSDLAYNEPFRPALSDLRTSGLEYTLFSDPARLADNYGFSLELPSVSGSLYNLASVMVDETGSSVLSNLFMGQDDIQNNLFKLFTAFAGQMGYLNNQLLSADLGFGFGMNSFAAGVNARLKILTYNQTNIDADLNAGLETDLALTLAYGRSVYNDGKTKVNAGIALRPTLKIISKEINVPAVLKWDGFDSDNPLESIDWGEVISSNIKINAGFGLPFDFSMSFTRLDGKLVFKALASNINGTFYVNDDYYSYTELAQNIIPSSTAKMRTPMQLGASMVYRPGIKYVDPTFSFEFRDINGYLKTKVLGVEDVKLKNILMYLNADVNLNVLQILDVTAGIHGGYAYAGVAMGFGGNTIQVFYNWSEFGQELGEKPVDTFTVRVKLGYER